MTISLADRITGTLLGGAVGDAIGAWYEEREPPAVFSVPPVLRITDDTQFTLATCEAILEAGSVDPEVMARHFAGWYRQRRFSGVGASTLKALIELEAGGHWALVGATGERAAGNGAAMRAAPLAFFLDPDDETDRRTIRDVCFITHRHDEAYIGALAIIRTLRYLVAGGLLDDELWPHLIATLPDSRVRDRLIEIQALKPSIEDYTLRYGATGYVVDSVPLALLAAVEGGDYLASIARIVSCGGDTDTNASLFGQIHGAAHGPSSIPGELTRQVDTIPALQKMATELTRLFMKLNHLL